MNCFHIIAGKATLVSDVAIEIDSADELFERRRLQNDLAVRVCDEGILRTVSTKRRESLFVYFI